MEGQYSPILWCARGGAPVLKTPCVFIASTGIAYSFYQTVFEKSIFMSRVTNQIDTIFLNRIYFKNHEY